MKAIANNYDVAIVGGGPAGLFMGCCLHKAGVSCVVFDERSAPVTHSRSIGIQPVSLELFDKIGLAESLISAGIKVKEGRAFCHEKLISPLSFSSCPPPYRFILTLPQHKTEQFLTEHLNKLDEKILQRNTAVTGFKTKDDRVLLKVQSNDVQKWVKASFAAACDGKNSFLRQQAGISFEGKNYNDTYIMGDFSDNTALGDAAGIFLCRQGVIESFPIAKKMRRWVVKTRKYMPKVARQDIETLIKERINHDLGDTENVMLSSFGVQKRFAEVMAKGRLLLAGDAAHIVSPIGGQGMNLGWLDGWDASQCLLQCLANRKNIESILNAYSRRRLKIARKAARRTEFNMTMGKAGNDLVMRKWLLWGTLKTPVSRLLARLFTMRGLNRYPI